MRADRILVRTALIMGVLTVPALIYAAQMVWVYRFEGVRLPIRLAVTLQLCHWYLWAGAGPLAWALTLRWPVVGRGRGANIARHAAAAVVVSVLVIGAYVLIYQGLLRVTSISTLFGGRVRGLGESFRFFFTSFFFLELLVYAGVVAVAQAAASTARLRARETEALRLSSELATARLETLRSQLQPHFLFNTLHTIGSLVLQQKNDRAVRMLAELGDLLRETLDRRHADLIPLRDEVAHLRRYVRIEEARFGDRLVVTWAIAPEAEDALVPSFILQPIVENAFRHGISKRTDAARLDVRARVDASALVIDVYNDGPPLPRDWSVEAADGFGLRNVRERLAARPGASFAIANADGEGVRATLVLPRATDSTDFTDVTDGNAAGRTNRTTEKRRGT
jgi:two-component system, LytTR family, sensor kinase